MKKLVLLCMVAVSFLSCSDDDLNGDTFHQELIPIDEASLPDEFIYNQVYTITYTYRQPSTCHFFKDLYYDIQGDTRTVAVVSRVLDNNPGCEELTNEVIERSFNFICTKTSGSYFFEFWNGVNENGENVYITYEVPILD